MYRVALRDLRVLEPDRFQCFKNELRSGRGSPLPAKGDGLRDDFTRKCLCLAAEANIDVRDRIIVSITAGNIDAISAFEQSCIDPQGGGPSAQHFAVATTSTAATTLNILKGAQGGNITIDGLEKGLLFSLVAAAQFASASNACAHVFWELRDELCGGVAYLRLEPSEIMDLEFQFDGASSPPQSFPVEAELQSLRSLASGEVSQMVYRINGAELKTRTIREIPR
ncbi:hypothetical protein FB593_12313 [Rhizobium sp. SJZ105]|nr:hypothetical protein FB593_12313 [Rhizobium sp. SJZ105]